MPAGPRSAARLVPVPRIRPMAAGCASGVATARLVALEDQRRHRVVGHRGEPDPGEPGAARARRSSIPATSRPTRPCRRPALGRGQRDRPIDALEPRRVRVDERERGGREALRPEPPARPRPRSGRRPAPARRACAVSEKVSASSATMRTDPAAAQLDQAGPGLGAPPVHHHHPAPLPARTAAA